MVTVPDGLPVETLVIWLMSLTEPVPVGDFGRSSPRRMLAIRRDDVPTVPRGTLIEVTEHLLAAPTLWMVDAMESVQSDHHRVVVLPQQESP